MQPSQLQIKKIQISKFAIEATSGTSSNEQLIDRCDVQVFRHEDILNDWIVSLTISFGGKREDARYAGELSLVGEFVTAEKISEEAKEDLVNVNGPAVLFSTAREIILGFTSRCTKGAWILPSVTFIDRKKVKAAPVTQQPVEATRA